MNPDSNVGNLIRIIRHVAYLGGYLDCSVGPPRATRQPSSCYDQDGAPDGWSDSARTRVPVPYSDCRFPMNALVTVDVGYLVTSPQFTGSLMGFRASRYAT